MSLSRLPAVGCAGGLTLTLILTATRPIEAQPAFEEEIEVAEVLIDVLVTDRDGTVVVGLGPDDFIVEDDGEPVELTSVAFYSSAEWIESDRPAALELAIDEVPRERYFIVLLQRQQRAAGDVPGLMSRQMEAVRDLEGWVIDTLQPDDWVAITAFDTRLHVLTDFTRDLEVLRGGLSGLTSDRAADRDWPSRRPDSDTGPSLLASLPSGRDLGRATEDIYGALETLAEAAGTIRARKVLILVGRGIGEIGSAGFWEPDPRYFPPMIETLNDNNVAVYPLDLIPGSSQHSLEQSFFRLAAETGGTFSRQFTSFTTPLGQIAKENSGYYLLSYSVPIGSQAPRYRRVSVVARNPQLRLRARQGYIAGRQAGDQPPQSSR